MKLMNLNATRLTLMKCDLSCWCSYDHLHHDPPCLMNVRFYLSSMLLRGYMKCTHWASYTSSWLRCEHLIWIWSWSESDLDWIWSDIDLVHYECDLSIPTVCNHVWTTESWFKFFEQILHMILMWYAWYTPHYRYMHVPASSPSKWYRSQLWKI